MTRATCSAQIKTKTLIKSSSSSDAAFYGTYTSLHHIVLTSMRGGGDIQKSTHHAELYSIMSNCILGGWCAKTFTLCQIVFQEGFMQNLLHYVKLYSWRVVCTNLYILQTLSLGGSHAKSSTSCKPVVHCVGNAKRLGPMFFF